MRKHISKKNPLKIMAIAIGSAALLLVLLAISAFLFLRYSAQLQDSMFRPAETAELLPTAAPTPTPEPEQPVIPDWIDRDGNAYMYRDDIITVLLIGVDYMTDESLWTEDVEFNGGNADALALAILDTSEGTMSLLYIPRDTMAELLMLDPDGNYLDMVYNNISAAHSYGDGGDLSAQLTIDAVSRLLHGVPIQRYASMDYYAIGAVNELLGGVEIALDQDYPDLDPSFTAGSTVKLTNDQFFSFVHYRDIYVLDSAFNRGLRHMEVLQAMYDQCKAEFRENVAFPVQLYNSAREFVSTNLTLQEISYLAQQVFNADFSADSVITIPGELKQGEVFAEYYPDEQWLHDFVVETFCEPVE